MGVSYILGKKELAYLLTCKGQEKKLPLDYSINADTVDKNSLENSLISKGYISRNGNSVSVEITLAFFIDQISMSKEYADSDDKIARVFFCPKLVILIIKDRLSKDKCKIVPIQDEERLNIYLQENEIKICDKVTFEKLSI